MSEILADEVRHLYEGGNLSLRVQKLDDPNEWWVMNGHWTLLWDGESMHGRVKETGGVATWDSIELVSRDTEE